MTQASSSIRGLLIYATILPIALLLGYLLATPTDASSFFVVALILGVLSLPLILMWHRPFLFFTWNMTAVLFFLPGRPQIWVGAAFLSFMVIVLQRMISKQMPSLNARSVTIPIAVLVIVVFITAKMTGGVGLAAFGSDVVGGKAYFWILAAALGYWAMTAYPIPADKRQLYVGLFLLGALANAIGSSLNVLTPSLYYIFLIFPVDRLEATGQDGAIGRYSGLGFAAMAAYFYVLSRYPVRDLLSLRRPVPLVILAFCLAIVLGSGYRGHFVLIVLVFGAVAYFEGLLRSRYAVMLGLGMVVGAAVLFPLASRLPMPIQRALSVLPVPVSMEAKLDAELSTQWRIDMWRVVIPEIPKYFWLGKGLGINSAELEMAQQMGGKGLYGRYEVALRTGAYHNGPLTVLIPFGIWGLLSWLWFLGASIKALYRNYKFGEASLKTVNTFILGYFCAKVFFYFTVFGEFRVDFPLLVGVVGLGLALNGGIAKRGSQESADPQRAQEDRAETALRYT